MRKPSDLGYSDDGFNLPALNIRQHVVTARTPRHDTLFDLPALGLREEREESRRTIQERCEMGAELLEKSDSAVAWCQLNAEGDLLDQPHRRSRSKSPVQDDPDKKEQVLHAFSRGEIRVLVTKPIIGAWGLNWQHCNHMTFFPSHSYEQYYQAVRRSWRFGQTRPVTVDLVTTEGGINALRNLTRKADQADRMFTNLTTHMRAALTIDQTTNYPHRVEAPQWAMS